MLGDSSIVRRKFALDPRIYHYVEVVEPTRLAGYADYALGNSGLIKFDGDGVLKLSIDHSPRFAKRESEFDTEFFCEGRKLHFESYPRPEDVPARSTKLAPRGVNTRFGYSEFQRVGLNTLRAEIAATLEVVFAPDVLSAFQIKYVGGRGDNPAIYLEETLERLLVPHLLLDQMDPGELRLGVGEGEDASLIKQRFEPAKDGKLPRIVFYLD